MGSTEDSLCPRTPTLTRESKYEPAPSLYHLRADAVDNANNLQHPMEVAGDWLLYDLT